MRSWLIVLLAFAALGIFRAQSPPPAAHRMEVTVERLEHGTWKPKDPGLVFAHNDVVRFGFRANFDGYLYVLNRGTSGKYEQLFPRGETGQDNRITAGAQYTIPATDAEFRIAGPAGYDLIYWLASPVKLATDTLKQAPGETVKEAPQPRPEDFMPRCDDAIFRARGECVDSSAGPQGLAKGEQLPGGFAESGAKTPRDLIFLRRGKTTVMSSPAPLTGPVIYEFRLAHK